MVGIAWYFIISNNIRIYIFWWDMLFNNSLYITFTSCYNQFLFCTPFYISTWFLSLFPWIFCHFLCCFQFLSCFFILFWMLWMPLIVNKLKHSQYKKNGLESRALHERVFIKTRVFSMISSRDQSKCKNTK